MTYEVEQKFYLENAAAVEGALAALGGHFGDAIFQSDTYLSHPARDFAITDEAFRLRTNGAANFITYKGPRIDPKTKTRRELQLPLPSGSEFAARFLELYSLLGFGVVADVKKRRRKTLINWQGAEIEVVFDEVEGLGQFAELEIAADSAGLDLARERIASLAAHLGLTRNERRSYCELVLGL